MFTPTSVALKYGGLYPIRPVVMAGRKKGGLTNMRYELRFWNKIYNTDRARTSFWASDFKHKYLLRTGRYYTGKVPESPPPGYLPNTLDVEKYLNKHPAPPNRETRHLPVIPLTPRVAYEHRSESEDAYFVARDKYRQILKDTKELEFHNWYNRLQRVRGRWCREQGVASRGAYGPAVDASEIWG